MPKRLLLVSAKAAPDRLQGKALSEGLEAIHVPDALEPESLLRVAREQRADGILALDAAAEDAADAVIAQLCLPGVPGAWREPEAQSACFEQVRAEGLPVVEFKVMPSAEPMLDALHAIDLPAWAGPAAALRQPFRVRIDHHPDFPLAFAKIRKRAPAVAVALQRAWDGPLFRLYGFMFQRDFFPVEIVGEELLPGQFPVPISVVCPPPLSQRAYQSLLAFANRAARRLPSGHYLVEFEFAVVLDTPLLVGCNPARIVNAACNDLLMESLDIDIERDCLRVAAGDPPRETPRSTLPAAVRWLTSHSGIVQEINGLEAARACPGVRKVAVAAKIGDTLKHVVDTASRDTIGYVLAAAPLRDEAQASASHACALIQVVTRQIVA